MSQKDYSKLRELLIQQETFPTNFTVKFIGRNSDRFNTGVRRFEGQFPALRLQSSRESSGGNHRAVTYVLAAQTADEIITVMQAASHIEDVLMLL